MTRRYVSLWFPYLVTDWFTRRDPGLGQVPFVMIAQERGRLAVTRANPVAERSGIRAGMALADARTLWPNVETFDDKPGFAAKLLDALGDYCIRYSPSVQVDGEDGLLLDVTGCAHLRGGEHDYLKDLVIRLRESGYQVRGAMADTIGCAWAVARFGKDRPLIASGQSAQAVSLLPPEALRIGEDASDKLRALGIRTISDLTNIPRSMLGRRFGQELLLRLSQALGEMPENLVPKRLIERYEERLVSPDGTVTAEGIAQALRSLLAALCARFEREGLGARRLDFMYHRLDGETGSVTIGTGKPCRKANHLFKLFEDKLASIEPALGIEVFILQASHVEALAAEQEEIVALDNPDADAFPQLIDRVGNRMGPNSLARFVPVESHWPERSCRRTKSFDETHNVAFEAGTARPIELISPPEPIEVAAPVPDYPPLFFIRRGKRHRVKRADGPERITREWWLEGGEARDYFKVEDEDGTRYWLFRSGAYSAEKPARWFLHGIFA